MLSVAQEPEPWTGMAGICGALLSRAAYPLDNAILCERNAVLVDLQQHVVE